MATEASEPRAGKVITDESGVWKPEGAYYGRPFKVADAAPKQETIEVSKADLDTLISVNQEQAGKIAELQKLLDEKDSAVDNEEEDSSDDEDE